MKNIAIQAILAIAIIVLYILHFSQDPSQKTTVENKVGQEDSVKVSEETPKENKKSTELNFAYVNVDTLLKKYEYYNVIQNQIESKRASFEATFRNRQKSLQQESMAFQQSVQAGTIDEQTARQTYESLQQKEQAFMQDGKKQEENLLKESEALSKKLNEKVSSFLKKFAEQNGYDMIFSFSLNSTSVGVMHGSPQLDVTNEVVKGLNEEYQAEKK